MMRDRRFWEVSRCRSPSPPDMMRSRDFDSSRNLNFSPGAPRGAVEHSSVGRNSRRVKRTDRHGRYFDEHGRRLYDDRDTVGGRDRDRYMVGGGRSRSPRRYRCHGGFDVRALRENADLECRGGERDSHRHLQSSLMTEQRNDLDRDAWLRNVRLLCSDGSGKIRDVVGFDSGIPRRSYDEPRRRDGLGDVLDRYKTYDRVNGRDYDYTGEYGGFGETNSTREENYLKNSLHLDPGHGGQFSGVQYFGSTNPLHMNYEMGGSIRSLVNSSPADDIPMSKVSSARGVIHMSSVTSPRLSSFTVDLGHFHLQDDIHQEKRDATYHDSDHYFEKKYAEFYLQDELLGIEKQMGKGIDNDGKEHNVQPSRDYFNNDHNYIRSSSHPKDFPSAFLSMTRDDFPGYNSPGNIHVTSHSNQTGGCLSSGTVGYASEKEQMISPRGFVVQLNDTNSQSRLYLGLPKENCKDLLSPEYGRSKIHHMTLRPGEEDNGHHYSPKTNNSNRLFDEFYHQRKTKEGSRKIFPYPEPWLTPEKVGAYGSVHARRIDLEISPDGNSYLNYDPETKQYSGYGSLKQEELYIRGDGDLWPVGERYDMLQTREYIPSANIFCDSPQKRFGLADLNLAEQSERWMRDKHDKDEIPYEYDGGYQISTDENGIRKIRRASTNMVNCQPTSSHFVPRHSTSTHKSKYRDISQETKCITTFTEV